ESGKVDNRPFPSPEDQSPGAHLLCPPGAAAGRTHPPPDLLPLFAVSSIPHRTSLRSSPHSSTHSTVPPPPPPPLRPRRRHRASVPRSCASASFSAPPPSHSHSLSLPSDALSLSHPAAYGRPAKLIISCTLAHIYFIS
ncbi:hypothetical protein, partial [Duncaniella freteri]|uniref:hypothetical protein n=1 Tax=Duncaniella freteri TaxID=2530391 RepID=UPI002577DEBC